MIKLLSLSPMLLDVAMPGPSIGAGALIGGAIILIPVVIALIILIKGRKK